MRRYHQERALIRRHHRDHLRGAHGGSPGLEDLPRGRFRKRHALPLPPVRQEGERVPGGRDRQEWQAARTLREGVQEVWQEKLHGG